MAAVNGAYAVVLSGDEDAVVELKDQWRCAQGGRQSVYVSVTHSTHLAWRGCSIEYARVAAGLTFAAPLIPIVSNLTGEPVLAEQVCEPSYWVRQVREPVRFYDGIRWLAGRRASCMVELGPDGVLSAMSLECLSS